MIAGIDEMLSKNISFSLYMTHGGTNWGHWAGANSRATRLMSHLTITMHLLTNRAPTPKYWELRKALEKYTDGKQFPSRAPIKTIDIKPFAFSKVAPIFSNLPEPKSDVNIRTMEEYDRGFRKHHLSDNTSGACKRRFSHCK